MKQKEYLYSEMFKLVAMHRCFKRHILEDDADEWYDRLVDHAVYMFGDSMVPYRVIDALGAYEQMCQTSYSEEVQRLADFLGFTIDNDWDDLDQLGEEDEDEPDDEPEDWEDDTFEVDPGGYLELQADLMRDRIRDEMMEAV